MGRKKTRKDGTPLRVWGHMGRPPAEIDKKQFENLCSISPTLLECCAIFKVDEVTLNTWCKKTYGDTFSQILPSLGATGKISLRRKIWQMALEKEEINAIKMLANKHLDMSTTSNNQPGHVSVEQNSEGDKKTVSVTWVQTEGKDYFDK